MFHLNSKCFPLVCRTEGSAGGLANCQEPEHARACSTFEKHWSIRFNFPCLKMFKVASKTNRGSECSAFPPFGPATHAVKPGKGRSTFKHFQTIYIWSKHKLEIPWRHANHFFTWSRPLQSSRGFVRHVIGVNQWVQCESWNLHLWNTIFWRVGQATYLGMFVAWKCTTKTERATYIYSVLHT